MADGNPSGDERAQKVHTQKVRTQKVRIPVKGNSRAETAEATEEAGEAPGAGGPGTTESETGGRASGAASPEAADWRDRYLRLAADLENTKKRLERIHSDRALTAQERLLRDLLPLADNLERALAHATPAEQQSSLYSGIKLTLKEFLATLEKHGVRRMEALGEPFDPEMHEAIGSASHPTLAPGTVMHVELPGYTFNGRLLRPARVLVVAG